MSGPNYFENQNRFYDHLGDPSAVVEKLSVSLNRRLALSFLLRSSCRSSKTRQIGSRQNKRYLLEKSVNIRGIRIEFAMKIGWKARQIGSCQNKRFGEVLFAGKIRKFQRYRHWI